MAPWRGFQDRYFHDPLYRKQYLDRTALEEIPKEDETPANNGPPKEEEKLEDLVEQSKEPLFQTETAIPLNPFPHKVIIDINKVTVIYRYFFFSQQIHSIYVKDVSDVLIETGWFWSKLKIIDIGFTEDCVEVCYLNTKDAVKARKIIQGLVVAHKNGIDLSKYHPPDLSEKLAELGKAEKAI